MVELEIKVFSLATVAAIFLLTAFHKYQLKVRGEELPDKIIAVIDGDEKILEKTLFENQWWFLISELEIPVYRRMSERIESGVNYYEATLWRVYHGSQRHFGIPAKNLYFEDQAKLDEINSQYIG